MYRDEHNAMVARLDALAKTEELNEAMKRELLELRRAVSQTPLGDPYRHPGSLGPAERVALGEHQLVAFPVWAAGLLHFFTFGLFSLIFYGIQHGRLPHAASRDPSTAQAIGYQFIPFFNYYWLFFSPMRLCDRVTLQLRLRGSAEEAPKGLVMASAILTVIPYLNLLVGIPILWTISTCLLQAKINKVVALGAVDLSPQLERVSA